MTKPSLSCAEPSRSLLRCLAGLGLLLSAGCSALLPAAPPQPVVYQLDGVQPAGLPSRPPSAGVTAPLPTLLVQPPSAAAGFDSRHLIYVRELHRLEHFANSEWADTPARMLVPLMVTAIDATGGFGAVGAATSGLAGDMRLGTEILRLQQDFGQRPSQVRFTLRATLLDSATRRVVASRAFDTSVPSASEDPRGGVAAANLAVQTVLSQLARFCAEAAASSKPRP